MCEARQVFPKDQWERNQRPDKPKGYANVKAIQHGVGHGTGFQDREHFPAHQETLRKAKESYQVS